MTNNEKDNTKTSYDRWMEFLHLIDTKRGDSVASVCVLSPDGPDGSEVRVEMYLLDLFEIVINS